MDRFATLTVFESMHHYIQMPVKTLRELAARAAARDLPIGPLALPAELITLIHFYVLLAEAGYDISQWCAWSGRLDLLVNSHKNRWLWNTSRTCELAAIKGSLECLRYAHENGCPWDSYTCTLAARSGSLECLRYAHENGCPWGKAVCSAAAIWNNIECLKYARGNGCPWDWNACRRYAAYNPALVAWIDSQP